MQFSPWLKKPPRRHASTAASMSASGKTTQGALPPSSSDTLFMPPAAVLITVLPTSVEPVNATLLIPGCSASAWPATAPSPGTTFSTPSGSPASEQSLATSTIAHEVSSAGLRTMVHPATRAGAIFQKERSSGKFHGIMCAATPTGSFTVRDIWFSFTWRVSPLRRVCAPE